MYIDNQIKRFRIRWNDIATHTYERVSRSKWKLHMSYACGAEMSIENLPDDLIQCLVLGAFNSAKEIESNIQSVTSAAPRPQSALATWAEVQPFFLE